MKKIISCLAAVAFVIVFFTANVAKMPFANAQDKRLGIVATTFPSYDWVRQILGGHMADTELTLLLSSGVDLHSFQPSVEDIAKIANCDLFVYVGGESDAWVHDVLQTAANPNRVAVNLLDALGDGVKMEEIIEGMESDHDHDHGHGEDHAHEDDHDHDDDHDHEHSEDYDHDEAHDHDKDSAHDEDHDHDHDHDDHDENHDHEHQSEPDEHVWLSLKNAQVLCGYIAERLSGIDPQNAANYAANAQQYQLTLSALDAEYEEAMRDATTKTLLFGDRFPFRYLVDDYGLSYYAAFSGCSAETEASFETIVFLTNKLNEENLHSVMVTEGANQSIARTIIQNSTQKNQRILVLDSMQSVTAADVADGASYLSIMENNLEVLKSAVE